MFIKFNHKVNNQLPNNIYKQGQVEVMYFFCKDVTVNNNQYYCQCTRKPKIKGNGSQIVKQKMKKKMAKIDIYAGGGQTHQIKQSVVYGKQQPTLLQKLRKKTDTLQSTLYATSKNRKTQKTTDRLTHSDEPPAPYNPKNPRSTHHLQQSLRYSLSQTTHHPPSISFCLPKQILISHTFNEEAVEEPEGVVVEEESSLVEHGLEGKFRVIGKVHGDGLCEERLVVDAGNGCVVLAKSFLGEKYEENIHRELEISNKIGSHPNIIGLYQICFDNGRPILLKQPYTHSTPKKSDSETLSRDIGAALQYLQKCGIYMKALAVEDVRECCGVWKLANLLNFTVVREISIGENLGQLIRKLQ